MRGANIISLRVDGLKSSFVVPTVTPILELVNGVSIKCLHISYTAHCSFNLF